MKKRVLIGVIGLAIIIIVFVTWYFFFSAERCEDIDCFNKHFAECSRASYLNKGEWTYQYNIKGIKNGECVVDIKLIFAGLENKFDSIVGKSMRCSIPLRKIDLPEKDLEYCTGPLKEGIQYLVIKDLYQYAAQNLGKQDG
jgi:hypothetical protein